MSRLALTENRLSDPGFGRQSNPADSGSSGYRFGRISEKRVLANAGRAARGARSLINAMFAILAAAKDRRTGRKLRVSGLQHAAVRLDGDCSTRDAD
jgi:hypothetical protein